MPKWSCCSSLCFDNYQTKDENVEPLKYYRLPRDKNLQKEYQKILNTSGINWKQGHICCQHWSCGERKTPTTLPDVPVTKVIKEQYNKLKIKYYR